MPSLWVPESEPRSSQWTQPSASSQAGTNLDNLGHKTASVDPGSAARHWANEIKAIQAMLAEAKRPIGGRRS